MGRPLNKRFFQGLSATGFQVGCQAWFTGEGAAESSYIVQQKSNLKYLVESDAGPGTRSEVLTLVEGAPQAAGEMQVTVTPELVGTATEADIEIDIVGGVVTAARFIAPDFGGVGYFTDGTFNVTVGNTPAIGAGTGPITIAYTVDPVTQAMNGLTVTAGGTGFTNGTNVAVGTADIPDAGAGAGVQSARIINARRVKTFEGNTYVWNASGGPGSGGRGGLPEATLQETSS